MCSACTVTIGMSGRGTQKEREIGGKKCLVFWRTVPTSQVVLIENCCSLLEL